jgi:hypothetical protein
MYSYGNGYYKMWLHDETNGLVAAALYSAFQRKVRVRIWYGSIETGHAWLEEFDVSGRIGISMGPHRIPILLSNSRSIGGGGILDHCIVKIQETKSKRVLYEHPTFGRGHFRIGGESQHDQVPIPVCHYHTGDDQGWQNVANFRTWNQAIRWVAFMAGRRMTKGGRLAK